MPTLLLTVVSVAKSASLLRLDRQIQIGADTLTPNSFERNKNTLHLHLADCTFSIKADNTGKATDIAIYTDGSKTEEGMTAAFVLYNRDVTIHQWSQFLNQQASVFQAEIQAIKNALLRLPKQPEFKKAHILSDRSSSLKALLKFNEFLQEIQTLLKRTEAVKQEISLGWVKAHIGITGNEAADQLAKRATLRAPEYHLKLLKSRL